MYRNLSRLHLKGFEGMKGAIWKDYGTKMAEMMIKAKFSKFSKIFQVNLFLEATKRL